MTTHDDIEEENYTVGVVDPFVVICVKIGWPKNVDDSWARL